MKAFFEKYWWLILLFLVGIPLLVEFGITLVPWNGSDDGWLGFWGSYLGTIPSGLIAYFVAKAQIDAEKRNYRENHLRDMLIIDYREMYTKITIFEKAVNVLINPQRADINTVKLQDKVNEVKKNMFAIDDVNNIINILPKFDKEAKLKCLFYQIKESFGKVKSITDAEIIRMRDKEYDDDEKQLEKRVQEECANFDKNYYDLKKFLENGIDEFSK
ncbi:MAG: hypothetical protein ABF991_11445 [Liquorilactobacillus hordei]|uniref:hypothetical protein n=1 Tax=Liquorilactobacillus hordei TaxID=468911 RepID=UPI0039ECFBC0